MIAVRRANRPDLIVAVILLALALLLGGGSAVAPIQRMIVELAGVLVLAWLFVSRRQLPRTRSITTAMAILAAMILLIVGQLIPMPPGLWRGLPGRDVIANVMDVVDAGETWLPLSVSPAATRESAFFLIPPIAMFLVTLRLDRPAQIRLLVLIAVAATISALLVMIQAQGATWLTIYDVPHATKGKGIFANKNHNAALLVLAIPLVAMLNHYLTLIRPARTQNIVAGTLILFLAIAVFGCLSRAGLALLPVALLFCVPIMGGLAMVRRHWKASLLIVFAMILTMVAILQSSIVQETLERFSATQEGRYSFWPDVLYSIRQFLPWGSGFGTFVPVFRIHESLSVVKQTYVNHAHSDYLEIALEGGVPGLLILSAFLAWFVIVSWTRLRSSMDSPHFPLLCSAAAGILLLLAASIVDYPLRTLLLSCIFGVLTAVLASSDALTLADTRRSVKA